MFGVALHFLEDCWTLNPRTRDRHTKYERELNKARLMDFRQLTSTIRSAAMPEKAINTYLRLVQTLRTISEKGIEQWYDGIWQYGYKELSFRTGRIEPVVTIGSASAIARLSLLHLPYVRDAPAS